MDPKIEGTTDWAITNINGEPVTDGGGLWNAVQMSLFAPKAWWGNNLVEGEEEITSTFPDSINRVKITNETVLNVAAAAKDALQWLIDTGAAGDIAVTAQEGNGMIGLEILIQQGDKESSKLYKINWSLLQ